MLTGLYSRNNGKYTLLKEQLGLWCTRAKMGNRMVVATPYGSYVLEFKGEFKPKTSLKITRKEMV